MEQREKRNYIYEASSVGQKVIKNKILNKHKQKREEKDIIPSFPGYMQKYVLTTLVAEMEYIPQIHQVVLFKTTTKLESRTQNIQILV